MSYLFILPIVIIFIISFLGVLVYASNRKDRRNRILFLIIVLSALWIASSFLADHSFTYAAALFWTRFAILPPAFVLPLFLYFSITFPKTIKEQNWLQIAIFFFPGLFYLLFLRTTLNVKDVVMQTWGTSYVPGLLYSLFIPYFLVYAFLAFRNFYTSYKTGDQIEKAQIIFVVLGLLSAFLIGIITNVVFPLFGESKISVVGPSLAILLLTSFSTYAILKHHLFNIKVITVELLTFAIWIFLLIQLLIADTVQAKFTNGILLSLVIIFGLLLIRSVRSEIRQRERLQLLTKELEDANLKLKEVDKLKTEFLGLASHQVRSPLTAIKGIASMLLENSFGKLATEEQRVEIDHILQSSNNLIRLIEDLLNVSKIEQGGMQYDMQSLDIVKLIQEVLADLDIVAKKKGLDLSIEAKDKGSCIIQGDALKLKQVFLNLVDNAIKYTEKGFVHVTIAKHEITMIQIVIADSGVGISNESLGTLFGKFSRGENKGLNTGGSGLGLYLAKEIVLAHQGTIEVESGGVKQGTKFTIKLPAV